MTFSSMLRRLPLMYLLIGACLVILTAGLKAAGPVVNPVMMAVFLALLLGPTVNWLRRRRVPAGLAISLVIVVVVLAGLAGLTFLGASLRQVATQLPAYSAQLGAQFESLRQALLARGITSLPEDPVPAILGSPDTARAAFSLGTGALRALLGVVASMSLTLFIFAFVLGGTARLEHDVATRPAAQSEFGRRFMAFAAKMRTYMGVRAVLGLVAAVADYLLLWAVGVEHAVLWAVISFLLSFVPNIGFTLSVIPPTAMALLGLGWQQAMIVLVGYIIINNVVDNVIGPRYVGAEMKMSALLSFLSVIFWAWILGPTGAVLAVPITVFIRDVVMGVDTTPLIVTEPAASPPATAPPPAEPVAV